MYPFRNGSCGQQIPHERKGTHMKKLLTAFLAMAFLVGTLGCPSGDKKKDKPADTKKPGAAATDTPPAPPAGDKDKDKKAP
jgi:hypothetical protein